MLSLYTHESGRLAHHSATLGQCHHGVSVEDDHLVLFVGQG